MINPGVISLASLKNTENVEFPYRFEIEDNIGEAIHIHYKDIRLDLTVEEFRGLTDRLPDIINQIVSVDGFDCRDFDPVVLVGIAGLLPGLQTVEIRQIYLEDILVDTFDASGQPIYASIAHSRVFKALNGLNKENDGHTVQLNHFHGGQGDKISNQERVMYNLEHIREYGYPVDGELIGVDEQNHIWDGQHRAAALYYLYGNIEVPVRCLHYGATEEEQRALRRNTWQHEHDLYIEELRRQEEVLPCAKSSKTYCLKRLAKHIVWTTWHKSDKDRDGFMDTLREISNRLQNLERKVGDK